MPSPSSKGNILSSVLFALITGCMSPLGHAQENAPWVGETLDGKKCEGGYLGFGPYDYTRRAQLPAELEVVERAHFRPEIERLETNKNASSSAIGDIDYTLKAWPNHHRALNSAMKYRLMFQEWPETSSVPPAECQLQRAIAFSPNDPVPYMMYGMLLHKWERYEQALFAYRAASRLRPDDILTLYNMGLTLAALEQYDEAEEVAKTVYGAGMPLPGLKNKLIAAGHWGAASKAPETKKTAPKVEVQKAKNPSNKPAQKDSLKETKN